MTNSKMIIRTFLLFFFSATIDAFTFINDEECLNYTVYPVQYDLTIIPYIYNNHGSYYDCEITITVIANAPNVQAIELDAKDMEIKAGMKVIGGGKDLVNQYRPHEYNKQTGKLYIYLQEPLKQYSAEKIQYHIKISFRKSVDQESTGIFLVPYMDGEKKFMVATRLSPNKAKYFFPCFDNPRFEAVFKFKVYVIPSNIGVQHMNTSLVIAKEQRHHELKDNYAIYEYIPSPQVALHQVGFHYSQFGNRQVIAKKTNDSLILWAPHSKLQYYDFILQYGEGIINLIHDYASVNRPLVYGPINVVSIPAYLEGYEVGSWNLLSNGEHRLAYVPQFTSIKQEERMTFELAQQLSRIWLGSPGELQRTRWKEEWFREGLATYLAYYFLTQYQNGVTSMRTRWPMSLYGLRMKHKAMAEDWHHSTPALSSFNRTLAIEIPFRYKELVNTKTASIFWMVENWLGSEKFHMALVKYINTRRGQFVSLKDFMSNLDLDTTECLNQFFNGSTASRILNSWFNQPGYPIIHVNVLRDRTPNAIQLKQRKFSFTSDSRGDSQYLIPISYVVQNNQNCFNCYRPRFTIDQTYTFEENLNGGWILLNRNASGYYRVNYDVTTWKLIAKSLKEDRLSIDEQNRAQIVNDAFALYAAGEMDQSLALEILDYLDLEFSPMVWESVISGFDLLKMNGAACNMTKTRYKQWQEFMRKKISKVYSRLIGDNSMHRRIRMFRSGIVGLACAVDYLPCVRSLRYMYGEYMSGRQRLDPDLRQTCYYTLFETEDNFTIQGFNTFENEDRIIAEHKMRKEKQFMYRIPNGLPEMDRLVALTTTAPSTTQIPEEIPEVNKPETQATDGAVTHVLPNFCVLIFALLIITVR